MESKQKIKFDTTIPCGTGSVTWTEWNQYEPVDFNDMIEAWKAVEEWSKGRVNKDGDDNRRGNRKEKEAWNPTKRYL